MEEKKIRKIGRLTFGITLVVLGIIILVATFLPFDVLRFGFALGPVIFISLGLEIIYFSKKQNVEIHYDVLGIILSFIMIIVAGIFSATNYFVNKVVYSDEVKSQIENSLSYSSNVYNFDEDKVYINNASNLTVDVKIIEDKNNENKNTVINVGADYKNSDIISCVTESRNNIRNYIMVDYSGNTLNILEDKNIQKMKISIITNNKENIILNGNFNIE